MDRMIITPARTGVIVSYMNGPKDLLKTTLFTLEDLNREQDAVLQHFSGNGKPH